MSKRLGICLYFIACIDNLYSHMGQVFIFYQMPQAMNRRHRISNYVHVKVFLQDVMSNPVKSIIIPIFHHDF